MPSFRFDMPAYDQAVANLKAEVIDGLTSLSPLFSVIPARLTRHSGPVRYVSNAKPLDQPMKPVTATSTMDFSIIRGTDIEAFALILYDLALTMRQQMSGNFFRSINELTDAFGNTIDLSKPPAESTEEILTNEIIEQQRVSFNATKRARRLS